MWLVARSMQDNHSKDSGSAGRFQRCGQKQGSRQCDRNHPIRNSHLQITPRHNRASASAPVSSRIIVLSKEKPRIAGGKRSRVGVLPEGGLGESRLTLIGDVSELELPSGKSAAALRK